MATPLKMSRNSSRRRFIIASILLLLVVAGVSAYFYLTNKSQNVTDSTVQGTKSRNTVDYSPPKPEDKIGQSSKDNIANGTDTVPTTPTQTLTVNISNVSQEGSTLHVRAFTPTQTAGTCTATFTRNSLKVTKTAPLGAQASYSICQGFDLAASELGEAGTWKVKVDITSAQGASGSAETTLEVSL